MNMNMTVVICRCYQINITEAVQRSIYGEYKCIAKNKYDDVNRIVNVIEAGAYTLVGW